MTEVKRAFSRDQLLETGFDFSAYIFKPLPEGQWLATLDAKCWGNSVILCYFTAENGNKYRLGAFRTHKGPGADKWYTPQDPTLDLSSSEIQAGQKFILSTTAILTRKGNPIWRSAALIVPGEVL